MIVKLAIVALYLAVLVVIGMVASRRMKDVRDYFAAGKGLGYIAVAFSARATGESAWLLLGVTGMGAALGYKAFWVVLGETLGVAGAWLLLSRRFKRLTDRYDSITVPDYFESRFRDADRHRLRLISAMALVIFVTIYVSAQIDATGKAFENFLGWDYYVGIGVGFLVVLAYIVAGGFVAVVWSDVFQGSLMFLGLVGLPIIGLIHVGSWSEVTARIGEIDPALLSFTGGDTSLMSILHILSLCLIGLGFLGSPQIFVRFIALRSEDEINTGAFVAIAFTLLADAGAVFIGIIGRAIFTSPGQEVAAVLGNGGEEVLPMLAESLLPLILIGLIIAIVLSAIMSTVDSLLVLAGSAWVRDVYQKVLRPETLDDQLVGMSRTATMTLAVVGLAIAVVVSLVTPDRTVFWFVIFGWSGISATFCPALILSLFWWRMTARGTMAAMIVGFVSVPLFKFAAPLVPGVGPYFAQLSELPPSFLMAFLAGIVFSLSDRISEEDAAALASDHMYATGQTRQVGDDPTR